ncbi:MAG: tetratricopeptide repeat protein [Candidatus Woesebacteria bacterium]|nr:tetratricopeptide repeat protein [Candidatus Woesebacteria bacterium]
MDDLAQKSITLALEGSWKEAIKVNKEILEGNPSDTDTLNRLAKAYFENGNSAKAKKVCQKIIKLDPFNSIALKNFVKWKGIKEKCPSETKPSNTASFIEESGKTKLVSLLNLGDAKIIGNLNTCDEVVLAAHTHRVSLTTIDGKYIGRLPDDLALRLRRLIFLGNIYQVFIKSIDQKGIRVFIKEIQKSKKTENTLSFPMTSSERGEDDMSAKLS